MKDSILGRVQNYAIASQFYPSGHITADKRTTSPAQIAYGNFFYPQNNVRNAQYAIHPLQSLRDGERIRNTRYGFTLTELIIVIMVITLFVLLAQINIFGIIRKNTFRAQLQDFVSTMQMASSAAVESERRYEVIIDLTEQSYLLREITTPDLSEVLEEEIIVKGDFADNCWVAYVEFDDGDFTNEGRAKFRAGYTGWQYGGKIVLLNEDEQLYSVVVNRLDRIVRLMEGDVEILVPKAKDELPF
jgi:prepilin-type N-terminal cleavage/methylation domain-containing protein